MAMTLFNPAEELFKLYGDTICGRDRCYIGPAFHRIVQFCKDACSLPRALPVELKGVAV